MSDWQIGDLAVCVDASDRHSYYYNPLRQGAVYTVIAARWGHCSFYGYSLGLSFAEITCEAVDGFHASRFRKVKPDEPTACETEFRILLDLSKKRVAA